MTLPNSSSTSAVPYKSTFRIVAGAAWLGGCLDERVDRLARGDIDDSSDRLKSGVTKDFCGCIKVILAQISQQDTIAICFLFA